MMQGDAYNIPFTIRSSERIITEEDLEEIEILIGNLRKTKTNGEINYNSESNQWLVQLTQEETLSFESGVQSVQIRAKFVGGQVFGKKTDALQILESLSKEVL